jgi:hypothetical protein
MNVALTLALLSSLAASSPTAAPARARPFELKIEGASCVDGSDLETALVGLLPESNENVGVVVELRGETDALIVEVKRSDGELLTVRRLRPFPAIEGRCPDRAQEIAVVVAAAVGTPDGAEVGPSPVGAPSAFRDDAMTVVRVSDRSPIDTAPALQLQLGTTVSGGSFAPAVRLGAGFWTGRPLGLELSLLYDGQHAESIGRGQALWSRAGVTGALVWHQILGRRTVLEAQGLLAAAVRNIAGNGYLQTDSSHTFDPGGGAGLRLKRRGSRLDVWLGADALVWPRTQEVAVRGADLTGDLARWDLFVGLGAAFVRL